MESLGSAPQDAGARMIVTPSGLHAGTVGGGKVEAIAHAMDTRADWLEKLPAARNLSVVASDCLADEMDALPDDSCLMCITQAHSTDLPVTARALSKKQFPSIDVIGSNDPHEIALSIAA